MSSHNKLTMQGKLSNRSDQEIIVMSLSLAYALCVSVFAVIRLVNEDWLAAALDLLLAAFGMYVFIHVWRTRNSHLPAYAIAVISVLGTLATLALKGAEQIYWAYPSVALVFYLLPNKHALILWGVTAAVMLALLIDLPPLQFMTVAMTIFITSFFCYFFSAVMNQQHNRLRRIANEDLLTQIRNRRAFNQDIEKMEMATGPKSAILFDLDNFKQINDYFGHAKGDEVLIQASSFIKNLLGNQDSLYRIGGDEFAVLCDGEDFNHAFKLAQSIHSQFKAGQLHEKHAMTLSMAVAEKEANETIREWFSRLDGALYKAKKSGRDRIVKAIRY